VATFIRRFDSPASAPPATVRVAVKDLIDMVGVPTTNGSKAVAASPAGAAAAADAACLAGTRAAEAAGEVTVVGKTNLHELAFGVTGINPWFGTPVNPLDPRLVPGGSSSGSAVAAATGAADVAFGSDTGGSIRVPAACCAVVGLKTTRGRISLEGVRPLAPSLDTVGPMAQTVEMTALGMALLEPGFAPAPAPAGRVGRVRLPADDYIDAAIDSALQATGLAVTDVELPGWDTTTRATMTILMAEAWGVHHDLWRDHAGELSPDVADRLEAASLIDRDEVAACWEGARDWVSTLMAAFRDVDVLALPTLSAEPPTLDQGGRLTDIRYVAPFNVTGTPALSMPVATPGRHPASLQLAGPARSEDLLLATASVVEAAAGWKPRA
jgi:amidase